MRITRVEGTPLAIPLAREFHWSGGAQTGANLVLWAVHTDEGVVGYGESICEDPAAVVAYGELMARQVVGHSPGDVEAILRSIWTSGRWRFWPQFTQLVVAGIEVACWDAWGKALGVPSRAFFGGAVRETVDFFGFLQGDTPEELARHATALATQGFEVIYMKVGRATFDDEECVAAVRQAIGPGRLLRIDPNEAWDIATAIDRIRRLEGYDIDWVEQPVAAGNVTGLAQVRRATGTKIAADQAVFTTQQLRAVLEYEAADVIVQGSHDAGGLLQFRQQAFMIGAHGLNVNRHAFFETEVSFLASLQVVSTIPNLTNGNQMQHHLLAERLIEGPQLVFQGGALPVPDGVGHCFELNLDAVARARERWHKQGPYATVELGRPPDETAAVEVR